jgi:hypothetical protein
MAGASPVFVAAHGSGKANDKDFEVNEADSLLYYTAGGVYGIGVWNMVDKSYRYWPYDAPYGAAVAFVPGGDFVYGASAGYYDGRIRRFNKMTGSVSASFEVSAKFGNADIQDRSLQVTSNGHILYVHGGSIGLIGAASVLQSIPPASVPVQAQGATEIGVGSPLSLTAAGASSKGLIGWAKQSGPGKVTFTATNGLSTEVVFSLPGKYVVELDYTQDGRLSRDRLTITVKQAPQPILTAGAPLSWRVPLSQKEASDGTNSWYSPSFDDHSWSAGMSGVGYETRWDGTFDPYISTSLTSAMWGHNSTVYLRIPFTLNVAPSQVARLELRARYDDGLVAHLNGQLALRVNAPEGDLAYNASAVTAIRESAALSAPIST